VWDYKSDLTVNKKTVQTDQKENRRFKAPPWTAWEAQVLRQEIRKVNSPEGVRGKVRMLKKKEKTGDG